MHLTKCKYTTVQISAGNQSILKTSSSSATHEVSQVQHGRSKVKVETSHRSPSWRALAVAIWPSHRWRTSGYFDCDSLGQRCTRRAVGRRSGQLRSRLHRCCNEPYHYGYHRMWFITDNDQTTSLPTIPQGACGACTVHFQISSYENPCAKLQVDTPTSDSLPPSPPHSCSVFPD